MKKTLSEVAIEMYNDLYKVGVIDAVTLREKKALLMTPVRDLSPREIKKIRLKAKVSQAIFAIYLNTSVSTIRQWEQGEKHPRGTSLKLLNIVANKGLKPLL